MADHDVSVSFGARTDDLNAAVDRAQSAIAKFTNSLKTAFAKIDTAGTQSSFKSVGDSAQSASDKVQDAGARAKSSAAQMLDGFGPVGKVIAMVADHYTDLYLRMAQIVDPIRAASGAFDQSMQTMSAISGIAARAGLTLTDLGNSFHTLQTKAKAGDEETIASLAAVGVKASEVANIAQDQLAVRMAEAFSKTRDSANKAQAAVNLFGSEVAGKLVPQLDGGAARMAELAGAANRTGQAIGPEFAAKVQGTESLLATSQDRIQEVKNAWQGFIDTIKMAGFEQVKGALDSLIQLFNDVTRNVLDLVEKFTGLVGAGQKTSDSLGLVGTAANYVTTRIIETTTAIEVSVVQWVQKFAQVGAVIVNLSNVVQAFGQDVIAIGSTSAVALFNAFSAAIDGIIKLFGDLATAGRAALSFDFSGVKASFAQFGADVSASIGQIGKDLTTGLAPNTSAAFAKMTADVAAAAKAYDPLLEQIHKQEEAEKALMAAHGKKGPPVPQDRNAGNPNAPDKNDKSNNEALEAALKELEGEVQAVKSAEKQKQELLDAGVKLHVLSEGQKAAATRQALDDEFNAEKAIYAKELALDGLKLPQRQEILNKIQQATAAHNQAIQKLQLEEAEQTVKTWDQATSSITEAFNSQINGLLHGTTTFGQAIKNVFSSLTEDIIKQIATWGIKQAEVTAMNIVGVNAETTAKITGAAAGSSAQIAGVVAAGAATMASVGASIKASAAEAFAGVTGFLSPVLGPAAVGPAAGVEAAVLAVMPSFAQGSWSLPSDMVAQVHRGEMIVPAAATPWAQSLMSNGGAGGGDTHHHYNMSPTINFTANGRMTSKEMDDHSDRIWDNIVKKAKTPGVMSKAFR